MKQKIGIKGILMITRDKLNNILVPVGLMSSIGSQIAECSDNLTAILTALEREVKTNGNKDGTEDGPDETSQGKES